MKDPYLIEHQAYLSDLQRLAEKTRIRPYKGDFGTKLRRQIRSVLVVGVTGPRSRMSRPGGCLRKISTWRRVPSTRRFARWG